MSNPQPQMDESDDTNELDGRRQRRGRNRMAVVDALLDLHEEGTLSPCVADIAERSGVSHRSVFRYFDDLEDLTRVAIGRAADRYQHLAVIPKHGEGSLDQRIERLIAQRLEFYAASGPALRAGRLKAPFQELLRDDLARQRSFLREQLRRQFQPELAAQPDHLAAATLAALEILTSLESYDLLEDQGLSRAKMAGVWRSSLAKLLTV